MALPLFSATLFMSAFVLFLVQPMIGKMILPRLGGTPQVWNTCMMFFQMALLAGYSYAHVATTRLTFRKHLAVHCALLGVPILVLFLLLLTLGIGPFDFSDFTPTSGGNPILSTLAWLTLLVGLPFFVVSTTSPLLQRWFSHTGHEAAKDPYFLSIASNAGSLIGLLAYPALVEPTVGLHNQAIMWWVLFALLGLAIAFCASTVWNNPGPAHGEADKPELVGSLPVESVSPPPPPPPQPAAAQATSITSGRKKFGKGKPGAPAPAEPAAAAARSNVQMRSDEVTWFRRLRWVLLAAAPSSLMLGVVTYICTDLSPIPLLWVIPLALYLITFILVFARYPVVWVDVPHKFMLFLQPVLVLGLCLMIISQNFASGPLMHITLAITAFFATALVCHGELALDRPKPKYLTEFWLWVSVGGMIGGIFNGLIAPVLFWGVVEFPIAIVLGCLVRPERKADGWTDTMIGNFAPGLVAWFRGKGDELAKARKKPEPHTAYLFNFALDVLLPVLLGVVTLWLVYYSTEHRWTWRNREENPLVKFWAKMKFQNPSDMATMTYNIIVNFLPMVVCFLYYNRPVRLGLGVAAILLAHLGYTAYTDTSTIYASRSYFGVLRVLEEQARVGDEIEVLHALRHGTTHHGLNYQEGPYRRIPTTYYHTLGPAGVVMLQYNWFKDGYRFPLEIQGKVAELEEKKKQEPDEKAKVKVQMQIDQVREKRKNIDEWLKGMKDHDSDARMPASQVGLAVADLISGSLPMTSLVGLWSEPPYATIGLGTGTMAAYGRMFQHVHYYEIDNKIRRLNIPELTEEEKEQVKQESARVGKMTIDFRSFTAKLMEAKSDLDKETQEQIKSARSELLKAKRDLFYLSQGPYFTYVMDARNRQAEVQIRMGDARLRMNFPYAGYNERDEVNGVGGGGGPDNFYHMMVVDAFSSDAIPIHLITKEAIEMYFTKLVPNGILCVHTSNRHVALVPVVEAVARTIKTYNPDDNNATKDSSGKDYTLMTRSAHDNSPYGLQPSGHYQSQWVMVARSKKILEGLIVPPFYADFAEDQTREQYARFSPQAIDQEVAYNIKNKQYAYWVWPEERKDIDGEIELTDSEAWTDDYSNVLRVFRWERRRGGWSSFQLIMIVVLLAAAVGVGYVVLKKRTAR